MSDFDLELDGLEGLQEEINDLEDDVESDTVYVTESGAEYSVYLEFGTENMPPYQFFRPAIREFKANPKTFLFETTDYGSLDEIDSTNELVKAVAFGLEKRMTANATAQGDEKRSPGTHPDHPRSGFIGEFEGEEIRNTSNLRAKIRARKIR